MYSEIIMVESIYISRNVCTYSLAHFVTVSICIYFITYRCSYTEYINDKLLMIKLISFLSRVLYIETEQIDSCLNYIFRMEMS